MTDPDRNPPRFPRFAGTWWFLPLFIVGGQALMRMTGYTAWAAQVGQEFMLTFMFYASLLAVVLTIECVMLLRRLLNERRPPA